MENTEMSTNGSVDNELLVKCDNEIPLKSSKKMFRDYRTADVYFVFKSDDDSDGTSPKRIPAHKSLLAAASAVFDAMFYGDLKENGDVQVVDASADGFEEFLQFFYVSQVKLTAENVAEVMQLADKNDVPDCLKMCANSLKSSLKIEDMCFGLDLAILYNQIELKEHCEREIAAATDRAFESGSFLDCGKHVLKHILNMNLLSCSEVEVLDACMAWVKAKSKQDILTKELVQEYLGDLFHQIRFASMTMEEFAALAHSNGSLFSANEYKEITELIVLPGSRPTVFNANRRHIEWNENAVLKCDRGYCCMEETPYKFRRIEKTTFHANRPVLLGSFVCGKVFLFTKNRRVNLRSGLATKITIVEASPSADNDNDTLEFISKPLVCFETILQSTSDTVVSLPKPILIRRDRLNAIYLEAPAGNYGFYGRNSLKSNYFIDVGTQISFWGDQEAEDGQTKRSPIYKYNFNRF